MKITIEFDSKEDAMHALNANSYLIALDEIKTYTRNQIKHTELSDETLIHLNFIREIIFELSEMD